MSAKAILKPLRKLKSWVWDIRAAVLFYRGLRHFRRTGETPEPAHQSMIRLFCASGGKFNDWLSRKVAARQPKLAFPSATGVLGDMRDRDRLNHALDKLRSDGCVVFPSALTAEVCDRLAAFAMQQPALIRRMDGQDTALYTGTAVFDPANPLAVRYDYDPTDLLNLPDVQALLSDGSLLTMVQEYLGTAPIADVLSMWWHTGFNKHPDSEAAQFFHFDMDRFKWVKIFIYLTDVGPENGPHAFVEGSHATGGIPSEILRRGYVRISDEEVAATYPAEKIRSVTAPRGSIILEDTRGLHKGTHVSGDPRLLLQLQFSNSLFGTNYPKATISEVCDAQFSAMLKSAPMIYRQYT